MIQEKSETLDAPLPSSILESNRDFAEFSPSLVNNENVARTLKTRLKLLNNIDAVWYEEAGNEIYVYIDAAETDKATLHSIFDAQYDLEDDFPHIALHFRVDSQELENRKMSTHLTRLI